MDRLTTRRKLLRGSLSAPVVLTVASPAALARSSFFACIARGDNPQADPYTPDRRADNLYRRPVTVVTIVDPPPQANGGGGPPATAETIYKRIPGLEHTFRRLDTCYAFKMPTEVGYTITEEERWELIYFDPETGEEVGWGCYPNGGSAVSRSCYGSFIAMVR